ncbi:hypothetical protein [Sphingomonas sp. ERG5]|uniref:hypothetical protein n=1 Tax=Sphingomonas sp. ERG5 TaxID=1381597 RepID=UPI00126998D2|nr:hypothetical protein [Sphingomonas sp. ERG5]
MIGFALLASLALMSQAAAPTEPASGETPVAAEKSHVVLLKAKIVALSDSPTPKPEDADADEKPDSPFLFHANATIDVQKVLWGSFEPTKTTVRLEMMYRPRGSARNIYLLAWKNADGSLDPTEWHEQKEGFCLTGKDAEVYAIPKEHLARLVAAGDVACSSDYVLLKAKILQYGKSYIDDNKVLDSGETEIAWYSHIVTTIKVQQVLWGHFGPKTTKIILTTHSRPSRRGLYIYVLASKDLDGWLDVSDWSAQDNKLCLDEEDAETYKMPKKDLARLIAAGHIRCR